MQSEEKRCTKCGTPMVAGARFCPQCGEPAVDRKADAWDALNSRIEGRLSAIDSRLQNRLGRLFADSKEAPAPSPSAPLPARGAPARRDVPAINPREFATNWLVAVGVNRFQESSVNSLQCCAADAVAIHQFFTSSGYIPAEQAYVLYTDADEPSMRPLRSNILAAVQYVAQQASADSTVILSFSSHGFTDDEGQSYILPEDGRLGVLQDTGVSVTRINEILARSASKRKIVFVDACRTNPNKDRGVSQSGMSEAFLEALKGGQGQITMVACAKGEVSREMPESGQGAYTHFLLAGLRGAAPANENGLISLWDLHTYLSTALPAWCKSIQKEPQHPWMWGEMGVPILLRTMPDRT